MSLSLGLKLLAAVGGIGGGCGVAVPLILKHANSSSGTNNQITQTSLNQSSSTEEPKTTGCWDYSSLAGEIFMEHKVEGEEEFWMYVLL